MANNKCISSDNRAFLLDLIDLAELVGPKDLEEKCQIKIAPGEKCEVDGEVFTRNLKALAAEVANIPICEEG